VDPEAREARDQRRALEAFHGEQDPQAVEAAWPHLASEDRFIRNAARVAVEFQPVDSWVERALNEDRPQARITTMVALARNNAMEYREEAIDALIDLDFADLSADQQLSYLRAMALVFMRLGDPTDEQREEITDALQDQLPNDDNRVNIELIRTLVYLDDARVIDKALALMQRDSEPPVPDWDESLLARSEQYGGTIQDMIENPPPTNKLEYAYMLRNLRNGWSIEQRREYFAFINEASDALGGASYTGFLERMRDEALTNASDEEIAAVSDLTGVSLGQQPDFEITPPEGPGREWTVDGAIEVLYGGDEPGWGEDESFVGEQSFERGRSLYHAIGCAACHRFGGYGGNIGPDLNTVARRFDADEMLEAIIHPSEIISDQYSSSEVRLDNGDVITGLVVERGDEIEIYTRDPDAEPTVVERDEVASIEPVDVSQMPAGLINSLNADELRDLMAYMYSAGDPEADIYSDESEEEATDQTEDESEENE
jgi:putative heme-binding domain-containing protein